MSKNEKKQFMRDVDLTQINFFVKIADFGFSKKLKKLDEVITTICGTPLYMAPQVVQKQKYSYKADIWSLGVILFELINGKTPFHSRDREEFENKVEASQFAFKSSVKDKVSLETILFMNLCLRHNEKERMDHYSLLKHPYLATPFDQ